MRIGTVARRAGVGVETVRFYERKGLVERPEKPPSGGFRSYAAETVDRIRFVRQAQDIGFSLAEIADLLSLRTDPATDCADIRARAEDKQAEVAAKIDRLTHIRDALDELIKSCPGGGDIKSCTILEAMDRRAPSEAVDTAHASKAGKGRAKTIKTTAFSIEGMHCDGCAERIRMLLSREPGVREARVSVADGSAAVRYNPHAVEETRLREVIENGGFDVVERTA